MPVIHSPDTITLEAAELGPDEHLAIGRLVRACAAIEDAVTLFIAANLRVPPGALSILIGQMASSKRLGIAKYVATARGPEGLARYDKIFPAHLKEVVDCRNAVCHGALMGRGHTGMWVFETTKTETPNAPGVAVHLTYSYKTGDLQGFAQWAEEIAAATNGDVGVRTLREERQQLVLQPSRKSQQKPRQGG